MLRPGIITSEAVNSLTPAAEVFYRRLMSIVDDFGRYDGRVSILRPACYPLQLDRVREADVQRGLAECEKAGLVRLYIAEGKPYVQMLKWDKPRAKSSRWPEPPDPGDEPMRTHENMRTHMFPESDSESDADSGTRKVVASDSPGTAEVQSRFKSNESSKEQETLERAVEFTGDEGSRAFFQKAVKELGPGLVDEGIGEVKDRELAGSVSDRAKYLTALLTNWMAGRVGIRGGDR